MPIGLGIGLNISMRGGLASGFSLDAPVLAFASATDPDSDNTQDFDIGLPPGTAGHVLRLVGTDGGSTVTEPFDLDATHEITVPEAAALTFTMATGAAPDGLIARKAWLQSIGGTRESADSNTVTKTISTYDEYAWLAVA